MGAYEEGLSSMELIVDSSKFLQRFCKSLVFSILHEAF
jgi:hypothetical protein